MGLKIALDDEKTWDYICKGRNLKGIFQLETESASNVLKKIKPKNIKDLSLVNALNRPGSLKFTEEISLIRDGKKQPEYTHECLEPFLNESYGCLIYQESVLKIAQKLANFKSTQSNYLLKALGKKNMDIMKAQKEAFINGMKQNNYPEDVATKLFAWFEDFANYSFNKSHSISYSTMGYISAYIKLHYPLQFFCSLLNFAQYEQKPLDEISEIISELPDFGLKILPPSITKISNKFTIEDGSIRYPIGLIKGLGDIIFDKLKSINTSQINSLDGFLESVFTIGLNSRSVESIIISGGADNLNIPREDVLFYYWFLSELKPDILERFWTFKNGNLFSQELIFKFLEYREQVFSKLKQGDLFQQDLINKKLKYKSYFKTETTRIKTLEKVKEYVELVKHYKENISFSKFLWETYTLGFSYNCNFSPKIKTFKDLDFLHDDTKANSCGFVDEVEFKVSAKGNDYAKLKLKFDRKRDIMLFNDVCQSAKGRIKEKSFVGFGATMKKSKLNVDSIRVMDDVREKIEFYNKKKKNEE